ncbi:MAG: potassium transporter Kup [Vulcanimicrobiota bacterium]
MSSTSHPQPRGRELFTLALAALGVVYGDIGTSPIYALRESFHPSHGVSPTPSNIIGVLSLIVWSLLLVICVKYLLVVVRADHNGEGGILALTTLVERSPAQEARGYAVATLLGLFGTALLYGDGMLTPAISVLSAVEGLSVVTPLFQPYVVPITLLILVSLFSVQARGTARMGALFGPVVAFWLFTLAGLGMANVAKAPAILACFNPAKALQFFMQNGWHAFLVLGSVFLVVTGGEALYADMGHFGRRAIRFSWFSLVFPALALNYLGQGALLLQNPEAVHNPFFLMAPRWALPALVALSTAATVIASQALITGVFSLTMQAVQFGFLPRMRVEHTSPTQYGQIYVPVVNWLLLFCCSTLVVGFKTSSNIASAYGIAVTMTMLITTILLFYWLRYVWNWSILKATTFCGLYAALESLFLLANLIKVLHGGWFPLVVGALLFLLMSTWKRGRSVLGRILQQQSVPLQSVLQRIGQGEIPRVPGTAVFMFGNQNGTPPALLSNLQHNRVVHERVLIVSVEIAYAPYQPFHEQTIEVQELGHEFQRVKLRFGYMETPDVPSALSSSGIIETPQQPTYFLGRETLLPGALVESNLPHWRERLFATLSRNAVGATDFFHIPPQRVVELGRQIEF